MPTVTGVGLADTDLATSILTYHVVPGTVMAADVVELDSATTLQGGDIAMLGTVALGVSRRRVTV